jgi:hypothetical protein
MVQEQTLNEQGIESRRFEYADRTEYVLDFGPDVDITTDVVDETLLLIVDNEQYDIDLSGNEQVFTNNGLVTIEVNA